MSQKYDPEDRWQGRWTKPIIPHGIPCMYNWVCLYPSGLRMAYGVDIGAYTLLQAEVGITLEKYVQIGSHSALYSVNSEDNTRGRIIIGRNAKIGSHVVILPGVTIGKYSVIGAFSLVKQNIPDKETWTGIPARRIDQVL